MVTDQFDTLSIALEYSITYGDSAHRIIALTEAKKLSSMMIISTFGNLYFQIQEDDSVFIVHATPYLLSITINKDGKITEGPNRFNVGSDIQKMYWKHFLYALDDARAYSVQDQIEKVLEFKEAITAFFASRVRA